MLEVPSEIKQNLLPCPLVLNMYLLPLPCENFNILKERADSLHTTTKFKRLNGQDLCWQTDLRIANARVLPKCQTFQLRPSHLTAALSATAVLTLCLRRPRQSHPEPGSPDRWAQSLCSQPFCFFDSLRQVCYYPCIEIPISLRGKLVSDHITHGSL